MSDIEFSGTDSEPVSDVNPEEMARLMADIDEIDDNLFKSNLKSVSKSESSKTSGQDKDTKRQVTFSEKTSPGKEEKDDIGDDDWDADDLLYSDDDAKPSKKPATKSDSAGEPSPSTKKTMDTNADKRKDAPVETSSQRNKDKKKLMVELFADDSLGIPKSPEGIESPDKVPSRKDKKKLMSELFGGDDYSAKPNVSPEKPSQRLIGAKSEDRGRRKKSTDDTMFGDDGGDLLGDLGDTQKKATSSPKGENFLDSLLSKSPASEKPRGGRSTEFILDEKYKNMSKKEAPDSGGFQGYAPSSSKPGSPKRRTPSKSPFKDNTDFDFLSDAEPRKRSARSAPQRKPFEVDDDDIMGNVRSRRRGNKEFANDPSPHKRASSAPETQKESSRTKRKDDWLFGDSGETSEAMKRNMDENVVMASVEKPAIQPQNSPGQDQDWLGGLLSSNKKSPSAKQAQAQSQNNPADTGRPQVPTTIPDSSTARGGVPSEVTAVASHSLPTPHTPAASVPYTPVPYASAPLHAVADGIQSSPQNLLIQQQQQQQQHVHTAALAVQDQFSSQMAQQLQQQQQMMAELLRKQQEATEKKYQEAMSSMSQFVLAPPAAAAAAAPPQGNTTTEQQKNIEVNLKEAEIEAAKAKAELDLIRKQHTEEMAVLKESHRRQLEMEREVWGRVEARLRQERDSLLSDFQDKLSLLQEEKKNLSESYQVQLARVKEEWSGAVERTREMYSGMLDRVKDEHSSTLQRLTQLKDMELKAALAASGHAKEVEVVMTQLESNTSELSELTASINTHHDSALELTQRALKMKEKQLQDFEEQLSVSRAEAESERSRLNTLIHRLENTLLQQGSEVEKEHWRLAQERMKVEMERKAMMEERKHVQLTTETERQNLAKARESLLSEHRTLLQSVAQQKQELAIAQTELNSHHALPHLSASGATINKMTMLGLSTEGYLIGEEQRRLREKTGAVNLQQQHLKDEERRLNDLSLQLEQDRLKLNLEKERVAKELAILEKTRRDNAAAKEEVKALRFEQQERLTQIATQTRSLHHQQEKIDKEHLRLQQLQEEVVRLAQGGVCPVCQGKGWEQLLLEGHSRRMPGDGGEGQDSHTSHAGEPSSKMDRSPASVLARLAAAREKENLARERRLLRISALKSS